MIFKLPFDALFSTTVATAVAVTAVAARGTEEGDIPAASLRKGGSEDARDSLVSSAVHAASFVPDKIQGAAVVGGAFEDVDEDGIEESLALENKTIKQTRVLANRQWKDGTQMHPAEKGPSDDLDFGILGRAEELQLDRGEDQRNLAQTNSGCIGETTEIYIHINGGVDFESLSLYVSTPINGSGQSISTGPFTQQVEKVKVETCLVPSICDMVQYNYNYCSNSDDFPQCGDEGIWIRLFSDQRPSHLTSGSFTMYGSFVDWHKQGEPFPLQTISLDASSQKEYGDCTNFYVCSVRYFKSAWTYYTIPPIDPFDDFPISFNDDDFSIVAPVGAPVGAPIGAPIGAPSSSPSSSPSRSPTASRTKSSKSDKSGKSSKSSKSDKSGKSGKSSKSGKMKSVKNIFKRSNMKMGKAGSRMDKAGSKMGKARSRMDKAGSMTKKSKKR